MVIGYLSEPVWDIKALHVYEVKRDLEMPRQASGTPWPVLLNVSFYKKHE